MSISSANPTVATFTRYRYVAVGAETSVTGADANGNVLSYSPGREQVYLNGVMLVRGQDYTATTGSSITGLTALTASDVVEVLAFTSFAVAAGVAQDESPSSPAEGQLWLDTNGTAPGVQFARWSKVMSAGVTSVSGNDDNALPLAYTAGYESVYRNGVLLSRTNDYTATNGTSITLQDATLANDIIEVFAPTSIGFADAYTQAQSDSKYIPKTLTTTTGDIIYASSANTPARLGIGSSGQYLTVSGGVPAWATLSASPASATAAVDTAQSTTSSAFTDLATSGPAVTLTTGTKALIIVTAEADNASNPGQRAEFDFAVSGATTRSASSTTAGQLNDYGTAADKGERFSAATNLTNLTAGSNTFTMKYRSPDSGTITFRSRSIFVMDLGS